MKRQDLLDGAKQLQSLADATKDRNRVIGSPGHTATVEYIQSELRKAGDYYDVYLQPFESNHTYNFAKVSIDNKPVDSISVVYSPDGDIKNLELVAVNNIGCNQTDYPASVEGKIAFIQRGDCSYASKVARAGAAKAAAVIIYNHAPDIAPPTLAVFAMPQGPYVPVADFSQELGESLAARLKAGEKITADMRLTSDVQKFTTHNVIAETRGGSKDQVIFLGAHSDSVAAGPGINDNGSGSIALLTIAKSLAKYSVNVAVRFAWWTAEEEGLWGSTYYVEHLNKQQKDQIRLYLNFDMIASPNYVFGVHDGDGSEFHYNAPPGSAQAEAMFSDYFKNIAKRPFTEVEFDFRSDYGPFLDAGIAAGGLDTGAEKIKTEEEAKLFGGKAGVAYDANYHSAKDSVDNLNMDAFEINTKAIAHAVATYATSLDSLGPRGKITDSRMDAAKKDTNNWSSTGPLSLI